MGRTREYGRSEVHVQTRHVHERGSAVLVVTGIDDELRPHRSEYASPDVRCVVSLEDPLSTVPKRTIPEQKSESAQPQVVTVRFGQSI